MMEFEPIDREAISDPYIRKAVSSLVRVSAWGNAFLVTTPMAYPTGSIVGVRVSKDGSGYWVSDFAMGYREAESIEAHRSFGSHAGRMKQDLGVEYEDHEIRVFARENQIASAIRRVSFASLRIMQKAFKSAPEWDEQEIGASLFQKLVSLYGDAATRQVTVIGASNVDWKFSAQVTLGTRRVLFDVVTPFYSSVCSAVSKFTDIRRLGADSHPVAVVENAGKMGKWLPLISQEAEVIDGSVSDNVLKSVVQEAA